jgi:hypothetical protein
MKFFFTSILLTICATTFAQIPSYVPSNGLVGWWPFNGNANDGSGNGNNGTVNGATLTTDRFGSANSAYSFNNLSDVISVSNCSPQFNNTSQTISLWMKFNTQYNYSSLALVKNGTSYINGFNFFIDQNNSAYGNNNYMVGILLGNGSSITFISNQTELGQWANLVSTYDGASIKIYLNGILKGTAPYSGSLNCPNNNLVFGQWDNLTPPNSVNRNLDDIGIWNRALNPTEITNLYNSVNTPAPTVSVSPASTTICPGSSTTLTASTGGATACSSSGLPSNLQTGLVGYWPFCGNANDASGNGNNGTVNGATLTTDRFGNSGSAYSFDGVNDVMLLPANVGSFSASFWFRYSTLSSQFSELFFYEDCSMSIVQNGSNLYLRKQNQVIQSVELSTSAIPNNQWVHIVVFYNNSLNTLKCTINGTQVFNSNFATGGLPNLINDNQFHIGARNFNSTNYLSGSIDDFALYNRELSASEIQQLYTISNATYSWSPGGATTQSITVAPTATTTYTVTASANGQSSTSTSVVTVTAPPTISTSSSSICAGQSATLTATTNSNICANLTGSLSSGLVGYWPFCGNANDVSGNGNNGTVNGATLTTDRFGNANSAYSFDGVNDFIAASISNTPLLNSARTISLWMNFTPLNNDWNGLVSYGNGIGTVNAGKLYDLFIKNNTQQFYINNNEMGSVSGTLSNIIGNWCNLVISYNGTNINNGYQLYINGVNQPLTPFNYTGLTSLATTFSNVFFGRTSMSYSGQNFYYSGNLDDIGIWNRALTTAEIQQLYTQGQTTYSWSPGGVTTPSITVSPTSTTTYTCSVTTNGTTCSSNQVITVNPIPLVNAGVDQSVCTGSNVTLSATGATTYNWSGGVQNGVAFTPASSGSYTVTGTSNGCSATDVVQVTVNPLPSVNAGLDFTKTCVTNPSGTLVGMTPVAGNTYAWTPTAGLSSASSANPTANPTATTTYTLTATNTASGCTATDQVLVTVNTVLPTINAGLDQTLCQGASTVLNASSNGSSLNWNNGVQNNVSFVPSAVGATTYTATATGANGCAANDNVVVTVNPLPSTVVTTNGTSSFCPGSSVQLCAPSGTGYSYLWSGNLGTTQCVTISSSATTSVTVTNSFNCSATSTPQQVTVFNNPVASAGLDATITCVQNASGAQIGDVPNPTYTYSWTPSSGLNSATIGNPIANPSATTTYTLTVVNADGCMGSDQVTVTVNNTPPTANAGLDQSICLGASLVLQGSTNGASGTWNNGVTNGISFTPSQTGTTSYTYSTVGANGCVNNDQVSVTVNALPVANAGQGAVITCVQNVNGVQLGANPISGNTYAWTPTSGLNNTSTANPTATPNASTTYTLLTFDANGCSDTAQVVVTVNNNPPIVSAGNDANVCNGDSLYLFANSTIGSTVVWNGMIQNGSTVLPTQSGYQVVTATAANGCTAQDSLLVTILQPTTSTLNEVACDEFILNGNVYLQGGTYTQLLTNAAGCDSTITLNLTMNLSPDTPVVYVQNEVNLSTDIVPGLTYQWIYCSDLIPVPGATSPNFDPAVNALYAVVVTNNCGSDTSSCTAVSTIGLADHQKPEIVIYPNPNNGHFTILLPENNGSAKLEVLDLNGRIIFESILDEQSNELHLESLSSGTYWLRINQQVPVPVTKY